MDDRKSVRATRARPGRDIAEKVDRHERELDLAERRLGEELYANTARFEEAVGAGLAEQNAVVDRIKERAAATATRVREGVGKAIAGLSRRRQEVADEPDGTAGRALRS